MKFKIFSVYFCVYFCGSVAADLFRDDTIRPQVTYLTPGTIVDYQPKSHHRGFFDKDMRIYCYHGSPKKLTRFFENVELQLEIESDEYTQYEGATPAEVRQHFEERRSLFSFDFFINKRTLLHLPPFKQQCIGIDTVLPYRVLLLQYRVDYFRVIQFSLGVCAFNFAGRLSHNTLFYYFTGITLGICSSFMLLVWLSSKLMPRRPMVYGMLLGGWAIGIYIIQRLWENLHVIFQMYREYVLWYILITGLLSFFVCYRVGPPKNQRSKNIIKWILQIMAIALIYFSSQYEEASAVIGVVTVLMNYFPFSIFYKILKIYRRFFPPKRRLLTSDEFHEQGVIETTKALNELRQFASSPDCKQWKIVSKLRDPLRFAAFVEGETHIRDEEIYDMENTEQASDLDESDTSINEDENLSEEGSDSEVYIDNKQTNDTRNPETVFSNVKIKNISRNYDRHRYFNEIDKPHGSGNLNSYGRNQDVRQREFPNSKDTFSQDQYLQGNIKKEQKRYNSKITPNYTNRDPYESDEY